MATLPVLYVASIVAVLYTLYLFINGPFLVLLNLSNAALYNAVYAFGPLVIGWVVILGMCKPLFTRGTRHPSPFVLDPKLAPKMYRLTAEVCSTLGAPAPKRIELTCELNASASFERGWSGFFGGQLVLTLGLPLVVLLTQRELAGVIAHEFGHFRQRMGMRASFLIRRINHWFARVVYTRSPWDPELGENTRGIPGGSIRAAVFLLCMQAGASVSRGILWTLMMTGHVVGVALMRQMEYNADRCEVKVAGSTAFESVFLKLSGLSLVAEGLYRTLGQNWRTRRRLPEDLSGLVERLTKLALQEQQSVLHHQPENGRTRWMDTHPSTADRIRHARSLADTGLDLSDASARHLFEDFAELSRQATWVYYDSGLNLPVTRKNLVSLEAWFEQSLPPALPAALERSIAQV